MARRHGALVAQRRGDAARRDDLVRDRMDARRVRRPAHHRQHVVPQALFRLARSLQHHPRQRTADARRNEGRMAALDRAVRLRDGPERLPLGLSAWRADHHGLRDRFRRRARHAMAGDRRRRTVPLPRFRPSRPRRAGIRARRPDRDRRATKALHFPAGSRPYLGSKISAGRLSSGDEHARAHRGDRRRRTALRRRTAPQRRLRRDPDAPDEGIRLRGRRLDDRREAGERWPRNTPGPSTKLRCSSPPTASGAISRAAFA